MGRKKIPKKNKRASISITLSKENYKKLKEDKLNKSKLVNWLLLQHFDMLEEK